VAKEKLKKELMIAQSGKCALTSDNLEKELCLQDTDRIIPKAKGGTYTKKNTRLVDPVAHGNRHKTIKYREPKLQMLKNIIDDREQVRKLYQKINNQILAYKRRTDDLNPETLEWLEAQQAPLQALLKDRDANLAKYVKELAKTDPLAKAALGVPGIGPVTVGYCLTYIDIAAARHASCVWAYAGLHKASHERYTKGETSGGNKTLRTALFTMADSQMKTRGAYRGVYDNMKSRLEKSEKITKTRPTEGTSLVNCAWKDTKPGHRHGAALRAIMKHFLADYWSVARQIAGLPAEALYPEAILGGSHRTIQPEERGWVF